MRKEPNFQEYSNKLRNARNINELLNVLISDIDPHITKDEMKKIRQKECNKKFKGNFLKYQSYCIEKCNEAEYYYYQEIYNLP